MKPQYINMQTKSEIQYTQIRLAIQACEDEMLQSNRMQMRLLASPVSPARGALLELEKQHYHQAESRMKELEILLRLIHL